MPLHAFKMEDGGVNPPLQNPQGFADFALRYKSFCAGREVQASHNEPMLAAI